MTNEIEPEDLKWLEYVRQNGELLEVYDKRDSYNNETIHRLYNRIEVYYFKGKVIDDTELTVYIKFENDEIIGFETY